MQRERRIQMLENDPWWDRPTFLGRMWALFDLWRKTR
jgi:hypothetical protein